MLGGPVYWPLDQAPAVLRFLREFAPDAPDELGIMIVAHRAPAAAVPAAPSATATPVLGLLLVWSGDVAAGMRAIAPLRALGTPARRPGPPGALPRGAVADRRQRRRPATTPTGGRTACPTLSDAVIEQIVALVGSITSPLSLLNGWAIGGAVSRVAADATAVGEREVGFELRLIARLAAGRPRRRAPQRRGCARAGRRCARTAPAASTRPSSPTRAPAGVRAAYGDRLARLVALKDRYDPDNVFRLNANIPPSNGART